MSPFRSILRRKEGEGRSKPKSPMSPTFSDLTKTRQNLDKLDQCLGCYRVGDQIRGKKTDPILLHTSFEELNYCAQRCYICRVFRKALLLQEVTFDGAKRLQSLPGGVMVGWKEAAAADGVPNTFLEVEVKGHSGRAGVVNCNTQTDVGHLALKPDALDSVVIQQAKQWLDTCVTTHTGHCDNLHWNSENPPLLIEILSPTSVRLRKNQKGRYVALSYCWGNVKALPQSEQDEIERGKTFTTNLEQRLQPFPMGDLPHTVHDALRMIHALGLQYAWIDTLCIVQDKPEGVATMHKVYSNAHFTLCSCATTRATEKLLDKREAWDLRTESCRLGGKFLTIPDMSLNELRLKSPLADRAWTLQEERLSPRMLYVSSSTIHWSCASGHEIETQPTHPPNAKLPNRTAATTTDGDEEMPPAQEFLLQCYSRTGDLHAYWADIVKSYAMRSMSHLSDRLTALSGLAAKYLDASVGDEYLAGVWAKTLADGLAWRVQKAIEVQGEYPVELLRLPSWSWAKIPLQTAIETNARSATSSFFERIGEGPRNHTEARDAADDSIKRGQEVKAIHVIGRTRPFWGPASRPVEWSTVSTEVKGEERFVFSVNPEQDMHAVQTESGRVLVYEGRKKEIVGQLDFLADVERLQSGELDLLALELGASTMLLLAQEGGKWRRVGIAWNIRQDYFTSNERQNLILH